MFEFFTKLFDTQGFPARWYCGTGWANDPSLGWLHILSDCAIFGAYTAIPLVIAFFILRRRDVPFPNIFWLFVIFIFACGTTHLIEAIIFWHPIYRFAGLVKFITAVASWATVVGLAVITPQALKLPGLAKLNTELTREIEDRRNTEAALRSSEQRLRENEERLRLAVQAGRMGIWEWDPTGNEVSCSAEFEAIRGRRPVNIRCTMEEMLLDVHPEDRERVTPLLFGAARLGQEYRGEYRVRLPNGDTKWLESRGKMFHGEPGSDGRMVGISIDVTDRKRAETEREELLTSERAARSDAERANLLKDEFLSVVSHELRTPLSAIFGYAQLLRSGDSKADELQDGLAAIERNCRAQVQIIDDLLDMSRIVSGKIRLDVRTVHLASVIEAALASIKPAVDAKGIRLQKILDPRAAPVLGDFERLQQVMANLLSNAVKFTPKNGRIQVSLERVNSHLEISVADTGQGIDSEFLPYVFDRFRQAEGSPSRRHGGLGLGLAIVKQIVELHGGTIRAKSPGKNEGATFTVCLPLQVLPSDEVGRRHPIANHQESVESVAIDLSGVKVMVVDDEPDTRDVVRKLLEARHAEVTTAGSAEEAIQSLSNFRPAVVISDIGMPGRDGYELIRDIRALGSERGGDVPAVAMTAFARAEDRRRALMAGYQSHVVKPVDAGELVAVVAMLTGKTTN